MVCSPIRNAQITGDQGGSSLMQRHYSPSDEDQHEETGKGEYLYCARLRHNIGSVMNKHFSTVVLMLKT